MARPKVEPKYSYAAVFARAREILMERGWMKGGYESQYVNPATGQTKVCIVHALDIAVADVAGHPRYGYGGITHRKEYNAPKRILHQVIQTRFPRRSWDAVESWNDASHRVERHVYQVLDDAELMAKEIEAGQQTLPKPG